eukprot:scaffold2888_cov274-Pinguiococcus_pyrenoidosus.AAC.1
MASEASEAAPEASAETPASLRRRHQKERTALDKQIQHLLRSAGKGKGAKRAAKAKAADLEAALRFRHEEELRALEADEAEAEGDAGVEAEAVEEAEEGQKAAENNEASAEANEEESAVARKRAKAARKRQRQKEKEQMAAAAREEERRNAGPDARTVELQAIRAALAQLEPPMKVVEVEADGNCLYRALSRQLTLLGEDTEYETLRRHIAGFLRDHQETFAPFVVDTSFDEYCATVESSNEWGGHLELQALALGKSLRIKVHRAGLDPLLVEGGDAAAEAGGQELHVSYHQYYYALGEHYNSVELQEPRA